MLLLAFRVETARYALDARQVIEVVPFARPHPSAPAPRGIAGIVNYHGDPLPLVDLTYLLTGRRAAARLSTRIAVVRYPVDTRRTCPVGLVLEHATGTIVRSAADFGPSGIAGTATPYLGPVATEPDGMLQLIELPGLLPAPVRDILFGVSDTTQP